MTGGKSIGNSNQRSFSLSGLLLVLIGGGLVIGYWNFAGLSWSWDHFDRLLLVGVVACLTLWRCYQLAAAWWWPSGWNGAGNQSRTASSGLSDESKISGSISWLGIFLVLVGIEFLITLYWRVPQGLPAAIVVILGLLCIVQGIRRIIATLLHRQFGLRPRLRFAFPKPGIVYLIVMTVLLAGSLLGRSNMMMMVFALMVGPFILNGWITFSMLRRTNVTRRIPEQVVAGEPFSVSIRFENRKLLMASTVMTVTDQIANETENLQASILFTRVPARQSKTNSYQIRLMQRGIYRFGPLQISTRFPLGLVERGLVFSRFDVILVLPRIGQLVEAWKRDRSLMAEIVDSTLPARGAFHDEFQGLRDYRPGDSPRSIHWRTSARRNELMVREFHQSRGQDLMLLIDLWIPDRLDDDDRERVELAVSFAATLCVDHMKRTRDARLEVAVSGREQSRWEHRTGSVGVNLLLEGLALVESVQSPDIHRLLADSLARCTSSMRVLILTTRRNRGDFLDAMSLAKVDNEQRSLVSNAELLVVNRQELAPFFAFPEGLC